MAEFAGGSPDHIKVDRDFWNPIMPHYSSITTGRTFLEGELKLTVKLVLHQVATQ